MAKRPSFLDLSFAEAIAYFSGKVALPTEKGDRIPPEVHDHAFVVSGLARADLLESIKWLLGQALEEGNSLETFEKQFNQLVGKKGWRPGEGRVKIIYDTNVRRSYSAGRYQQMTDPDILNKTSGWMWRHRTPDPEFGGQPREEHKALNGKVFAVNDPFWLKCFPVCAWGCRCTAFGLSKRQMKAMGKRIEKSPPPETIYDPEFAHAPGSSPQLERSQILKNGLARISPELRSKVEADFKKRKLI